MLDEFILEDTHPCILGSHGLDRHDIPGSQHCLSFLNPLIFLYDNKWIAISTLQCTF